MTREEERAELLRIRLEIEEKERQRKEEAERERRLNRARVLREKKKAREEEMKKEKRRQGLPLAKVTSSQNLITSFIRGNAGKKQDANGVNGHQADSKEGSEEPEQAEVEVDEQADPVDGALNGQSQKERQISRASQRSSKRDADAAGLEETREPRDASTVAPDATDDNKQPEATASPDWRKRRRLIRGSELQEKSDVEQTSNSPQMNEETNADSSVSGDQHASRARDPTPSPPIRGSQRLIQASELRRDGMGQPISSQLGEDSQPRSSHPSESQKVKPQILVTTTTTKTGTQVALRDTAVRDTSSSSHRDKSDTNNAALSVPSAVSPGNPRFTGSSRSAKSNLVEILPIESADAKTPIQSNRSDKVGPTHDRRAKCTSSLPRSQSSREPSVPEFKRPVSEPRSNGERKPPFLPPQQRPASSENQQSQGSKHKKLSPQHEQTLPERSFQRPRPPSLRRPSPKQSPAPAKVEVPDALDSVPTSTQLFLLNHLDEFYPSPSQEARELAGEFPEVIPESPVRGAPPPPPGKPAEQPAKPSRSSLEKSTETITSQFNPPPAFRSPLSRPKTTALAREPSRAQPLRAQPPRQQPSRPQTAIPELSKQQTPMPPPPRSMASSHMRTKSMPVPAPPTRPATSTKPRIPYNPPKPVQVEPVLPLDLPPISTQDLFLSSQDLREINAPVSKKALEVGLSNGGRNKAVPLGRQLAARQVSAASALRTTPTWGNAGVGAAKTPQIGAKTFTHTSEKTTGDLKENIPPARNSGGFTASQEEYDDPELDRIIFKGVDLGF
jgi:hypothetical protein